MADRWTAAQAGANCRTPQSPKGVLGNTYRYYVTRLGAPDAVGRDVKTGAKLYDPEAVRAWHAARASVRKRAEEKK